MSEAIKLNFENRVRDGSLAAVLVRVNVKPKLGTSATMARRFDHEFAFRTRLTLVACHRPALAGMSSALRRSAIVLYATPCLRSSSILAIVSCSPRLVPNGSCPLDNRVDSP